MMLPTLPLITDTETPNSCDGCGLCCVGIGSPVLNYQTRKQAFQDSERIPSDLPQEIIDEIDLHFGGLERGQEPQEFCLWYDQQTKRCKYYEWRPAVCRQFERGGSSCLQLRAEAGQ